MKRTNISIKHLLWLFGAFFGSIFVVLAIILASAGKPQHEEHVVRSVDVFLTAYADLYQLKGSENFTTSISQMKLASHYLLVSEAGKVLSSSPSIELLPLTKDLDSSYATHQITEANSHLYGKYFVYKSIFLPDGNRLVVAADISQFEAEKQVWLNIFIGLFLLVILAGLGSIYFGLHIIRRIRSIGYVAKSIMDTGDLSLRIEPSASVLEVSGLVESINVMLTKIEILMNEIRQVSDNIAHDLRTPLTRLRNKIETLELDDIDNEERLRLTESMKDEADNLLNIFHSLLRITNIESGQRNNMIKRVKLDRLIFDLHELYEPLAAEKNQLLSVKAPPIKVDADSDLLFQALSNLLDNAIKYTPAGGEIKVEISNDNSRVVIAVVDNGIGVDESEIPYLIKRFYRVEASRHLQGNGLGLSVVNAIVHLHKGKVCFSDAKPGLGVSISLPSIH